MVYSRFSNIEIGGMAMSVSDKWVPVEQSCYDSEVLKRFKRNTGIEGRYDIGEKQTGADFAFVAARELIEKNNIEKSDIKILVYVTQFPDYRVPATACVIHGRLGLEDDCMSFDINQGCSGLVYGLQVVCSLLQSSDAKFALLLLGDTTGKKLERDQEKGWMPADDNNVILFGNGGGAVLFHKTDNTDDIHTAMCTDGKGYQAIIEPCGYFKHPNGIPRGYFSDTEIFDFAIERPPAMIKDLMMRIGTNPEQYDSLALHQANKMIMKQVAKRAGFDKTQNILALDEFANTTAVSILSALVKRYGDEKTERHIMSMLCGFGIGLSWGAVSLSLDTQKILPLIHTDEWFDDGYYNQD